MATKIPTPIWTLGKTEARSRQGGITYVLPISEVKRVLLNPQITRFNGTIIYRDGSVMCGEYQVHRRNGELTAFGCQELTGKNDLVTLKKWVGLL